MPRGAQISGSCCALAVECRGSRGELVGDGPWVAGQAGRVLVDLVEEHAQGQGDAGGVGLDSDLVSSGRDPLALALALAEPYVT